MSATPVNATAALLVHRQASFDRQHVQPRTTTFAASVVNRFFTDNSLGRQKRVVETTRRRQAKAREKAREQEHRVEQLQLEYDEATRLQALRDSRELQRMERKLEHAAATYIQYAWRKRRYFARISAERDRAARCVLAAVRLRASRRTQARQRAAKCIQQCWRTYQQRTRLKYARAVIARCISTYIHMRRKLQLASAQLIQRWLRRFHTQWRHRAAAVLQRTWRLQLAHKQLARLSRAHQHVQRLAALERSAAVLQRALGRVAAYRRLIQTTELARYPVVMVLPTVSKTASTNIDSIDNIDVDRQSLNQQLRNARALGKQLATRESAAAAAVDALQTRVQDATAALTRERESLARFHALAAYRRAKADAATALQLQALEAQMRCDVRRELERDLELSRRAQIRERSGSSSRLQQQQMQLPERSEIVSQLPATTAAMKTKGGGRTDWRDAALPIPDERLE